MHGLVKGDKVGQILTWDEATAERSLLRRYGGTAVFTNGVFDLLHVGHLEYLGQSKAMGDWLVVGINGDNAVWQLKGTGRPIVPVEERAQLVAALNPVDAVVIFNQLTAKRLIDVLRPDIYVKGGDWSELDPPPEVAIVRSYGGQVEYLPYLPDHSTTFLIERVQRSSRPFSDKS